MARDFRDADPVHVLDDDLDHIPYPVLDPTLELRSFQQSYRDNYFNFRKIFEHLVENSSHNNIRHKHSLDNILDHTIPYCILDPSSYSRSHGRS